MNNADNLKVRKGGSCLESKEVLLKERISRVSGGESRPECEGRGVV